MRILGLWISMLSVILLSACANTLPGITADFKDIGHWMHDRPSTLEKKIGPVPTGYIPGNRRAVLAPPETAGGIVWNEIGRYDAVPAPPPKIFPVAVAYGDVTVFPVDGDAGYFADMKYDFTQTSDNTKGAIGAAGGVRLAGKPQQIFFGYGSSRVGNDDRNNLRALAADLTQAPYEYNVNVVGHASKRVDHVKDPVRRKMINFAMAQKRAQKVTDELQAAGVRPGWVNTLSRGDEEANLHPGNMTQEAADRRVDVYVAAGSQTNP